MNLRTLLLVLLLALTATGCRAMIAGSDVGPAEPLTEPLIVEEPTAEPELEVPTPAAEPTAEAVAAFCPEVARPSLFLFVPDEGYQLFDPASGQTCELASLHSEALMPRFGGGDLFYTMRSVDALGVYRLQPGGEPQLLPATSIMIQEDSYVDLNYIVSDDGTTMAWSIIGPGEADQSLSDLFVAPVSNEDVPVIALVSQSQPELRVLQPIRFSADNSVLYYTLAPMGIGGSWIGFTGRYDNLYAAPAAGGSPTLIFDCQELGMMLCLGDFQVYENELLMLAYVDSREDGEGALVLLNGDGQEINRLTPGGNYVGYPTISPAGELVFYSAELSEESLLPQAATLYRVAPPTGPAEVLAIGPQLILPQRFMDDSTLVVGYAQDEMTWGLALVNMFGEMQVVEQYPNAVLTDVVH